MSVIFVVVPVAMVVVLAAVIAFVWAARRGEFDDLDTPAVRALHDDPAPARRDERAGTERETAGQRTTAVRIATETPGPERRHT